MIVDDRLVERKLLIKRVFSKTMLFRIGVQLKIGYFKGFISAWDIEEDKAALEIASVVGDN